MKTGARMKKVIMCCSLIFAASVLSTVSYADDASTIVTAPTKQENTKTFTMIKVGNNGAPAKVTLDTGSSMLVLEKQYVKNFTPDPSNRTITMSYGNGAKTVKGSIGYADVTLNTKPKITAKNVPILMVPNNTFTDRAGIMGVEMGNQTAVWRYLPTPYNQMMIVNGPASTVSFGNIPDAQINTFANYQLNEGRCNNSIQPDAAHQNITCWATRRIPVDYIFSNAAGDTVYKATYNTIFDTGGGLTHFYLQPIPNELQNILQNKTLNGDLSMSLNSENQGTINIPVTQSVKIFPSKRNVVNSGNQVFYDKTVLFDAQDGVIGFK